MVKSTSVLKVLLEQVSWMSFYWAVKLTYREEAVFYRGFYLGATNCFVRSSTVLYSLYFGDIPS